jgi:hypothetical protein
LPGQCVITRKIAVAEGVYAPGRLGELTQVLDFDLVDAVVHETGTVQRRTRLFPTRVVIYVRHEALRCIPDSVGRNLEGCSWV